jgi:NADPH2:quinone reductase
MWNIHSRKDPPQRGVAMRGYDGTPDPDAIRKLNQLIESGPFEVHIARTFLMDEVADAHLALDQHYLGKLALRPPRV